jgi:hypothetical protein
MRASVPLFATSTILIPIWKQPHPIAGPHNAGVLLLEGFPQPWGRSFFTLFERIFRNAIDLVVTARRTQRRPQRRW